MLSNKSISHSHYSKTIVNLIPSKLYVSDCEIHAFCNFVIVISCICLNTIFCSVLFC